ncbi:MAG: hypothetical protein AB7S50_03915 [Bacteroidales bacterium]
MQKIVYLILVTLIFSEYCLGQPCQGFHLDRVCGVSDIGDFKRFGQSRSRLLEPQKTFKYKVVFFGGYDYKVGLCTENTFGPVHYRIINADDNSVFFDNSDEDYVETVGFTVEKTKNVIFEITLLAKDKKFRDIRDTRACAGVVIFWRRVPKEYFKGDDF